MMNFLKNRIIFKLMRPFVLVQFSPPRSGSTLVFNIMRELFPMKKIFKVHTFRSMCRQMKVVVTYRHPLDCIASSIIRYKKEPTQEELARQVRMFNEQGLLDLVKIKKMPNILMLKYEDYVNDFEYIFNHFENFFNITVSQEKRSELTAKYKIENVEKMIKNQKGDSFADIDKKTQLHGNHISKYKGASNYYEEFFQPEQIKFLKETYAEVLEAFDYQ